MKEIIIGIATVIVVVALYCAIVAYPIKWCWNYLMPDLFGLKQITFTQALVLGVLGTLIFGNHSSSDKSKS